MSVDEFGEDYQEEDWEEDKKNPDGIAMSPLQQPHYQQEAVFGEVSCVRDSVRIEAPDLERSTRPGDDRDGDDAVSVSAVPSLDKEPASALAAPEEIEAVGRANEPKGEADDNVEHLVLVVHGIGEMLRSVDLFGMALPQLSTISDCCDWLRRNHSAVHAAQFTDLQRVNPDTPLGRDAFARSALGRVEYLPVEWHEKFAIQSRRHESSGSSGEDEPRSTTLKDVSLKTIPALRDFANNTMLDVLYFMSPSHHDAIIDLVTAEANLVVKTFLRLTGIDRSNLKVSIIGHSLGSIIAWDILAHQSKLRRRAGVHRSLSPDVDDNDRPEYLSPRLDWMDVGQKTPEQKRSEPVPSYPQLSFDVSNFFMLGSPVAVFLMLRNQHRPLSDKFSLPGCKRVFNIFHPYDPVSYRIEPLIDPCNAEVDPKLIAHGKGGFRVQYQTKFMLRRFLDETRRTQKNVIEAVEKGMADIGLIDVAVDHLVEEDNVGKDEEDTSPAWSNGSKFQAVRCGNLNEGRRIDFMLQEKEIENANEYVFALSAHSSYWTQGDLALFVARQFFRGRNIDADSSRSSSGQMEEEYNSVSRVLKLDVPHIVRKHDASDSAFLETL